ncbi:MAG: CoA-binding protein [Gemmatimonadota bacterium]
MTASTAALSRVLREARTIAVVGLSPKPERPSHGVARYLQREGYQIIPIRPATMEPILGQAVYPDLMQAARDFPIDVVNIFRQSDALPSLVDDIIAVKPRLVWTQLGVVHEESARRLEAAGILVVMDRCLAVELHSLVGD